MSHFLSSLVQYTSVWPYFLLMALFFLEASLVLRFVPFFRDAVAQDMASHRQSSQLDGLRGILALSVFFTHSETAHQMWVTGGWGLPASNFYAQLAILPVSLFFMITGYLFWSKAQKSRQESLKSFFRHRVRRLFPAYLLALLLLCLVVAWVSDFHRNASVASLAGSLFSYLTFNLVPGPQLNNLTMAPLIYALVFWSLRVEWMFYLAYPILAIFAKTMQRQMGLLIVVVSLYVLLPLVLDPIRSAGRWGTMGLGTLYYFVTFLVCFFSFGMIASVLRKRADLDAHANSTLITCAGVALTAAVLFFLPPKNGLIEGALVAVPFLLIVFGNSFWGLLRRAPLVLLGHVSYSTYVLHGIVLFCANRILSRFTNPGTISPINFWLFTALNGTIVVVVSLLSYRFVEFPFMKHPAKPSPL